MGVGLFSAGSTSLRCASDFAGLETKEALLSRSSAVCVCRASSPASGVCTLPVDTASILNGGPRRHRRRPRRHGQLHCTSFQACQHRKKVRKEPHGGNGGDESSRVCCKPRQLRDSRPVDRCVCVSDTITNIYIYTCTYLSIYLSVYLSFYQSFSISIYM